MTLNERFQNLELLGQGMTSKVYKAFDSVTQSWVAVKLINPAVARSVVGLERFKREIQITRQVAHPQVIKIFDFHESQDNVFLVMELLRGQNLATYLKKNGPISVQTCQSFLRQLLEVLNACHRANIVHRDLKPQNIFVSENDTLKLLDFGISRMATLSDLTQTGTTLGTPEYMAPELFEVSCYDPRTDLYAVGVIMHELLTGSLPFEGETLAVLFRRHAEEQAAPITQYRTDVPEWLVKVISKLIEKKSIRRYQSASEALFDLNNNTVIAQNLPALERRECLSCRRETLVEIPDCLHCGFGSSTSQSSQDKKYDLWISRNFSPENLQNFLKKNFAVEAPNLVARRNHLLASRLDLNTAKLMRQQAQRAGIGIEVKAPSSTKLQKAFFWVMFGVTGLTALSTSLYVPAYSHYSLLEYPSLSFDRLFTPFAIYLGKSAGILVPAYGFLLAAIKLGNRTPLLKSTKVSVHSWFLKIRGLIGKKAPAELSDMNMNLIEKFLVAKNQGQLRPEIMASLEIALEAACRISSLMADLDQQMKVMQEQSGRSAPPESYFKLEESYSRLNNKLVFINSQFNSIVGKALSQHSSALDFDIDDLKKVLNESSREAEFYIEARREIKEAA